MLLENPVKRRFGGQVNPLVGERGNDLLGRKIPERHAGGYLQHLLPLLLGELVRRCGRRPLALILTAVLPTPPDECATAEPHEGGSFMDTGTGPNGFVDKCDDHLPFLPAVGLSSSPQISWTFFLSTSSAAVSAKALSFRRSSFSRARMRWVPSFLSLALCFEEPC
jgi:hypothetical protein